jgi:CheY-like chemotaxis protein
MTRASDTANSILVVDDDQDIRESLADLLRDEGYAVDTACNGQEALEKMRTAPLPDLVIVDLMMPVVDGLVFRARQKADPALASIPVVLLTASGRIREIAGSFAFDDCVPKPIGISHLLATIARHIAPALSPASHASA